MKAYTNLEQSKKLAEILPLESADGFYATDDNMKRKHGDINTLKLIAHNAIKYGKVERFVMVGGDPCEHPNLVELLEYIKEQGDKLNSLSTQADSNEESVKEGTKLIDSISCNKKCRKFS